MCGPNLLPFALLWKLENDGFLLKIDQNKSIMAVPIDCVENNQLLMLRIGYLFSLLNLLKSGNIHVKLKIYIGNYFCMYILCLF